MKKVTSSLLALVLISSAAQANELFRLVAATACAGGAVCTGFKTVQSYKKQHSLTNKFISDGRNLSQEITHLSAGTPISRSARTEKELERLAQKAHNWVSDNGTTIGWGTATTVLAITALRIIAKR